MATDGYARLGGGRTRDVPGGVSPDWDHELWAGDKSAILIVRLVSVAGRVGPLGNGMAKTNGGLAGDMIN